MITGVDPAGSLTVDSTPIQITGSDLIGALAIEFGSEPGTILSTAPNPNGGDILTAIAPPNGAGTVNVQIVGADAYISPITPADQFTYTTPQPVVTSVSPGAGNVAGQQSITISGEYLEGVSEVRFGGKDALSFTYNPPSGNTAATITAVDPEYSEAGPVNVQVVTPGGTSNANPNDVFTYGFAPSVTHSSIRSRRFKAASATKSSERTWLARRKSISAAPPSTTSALAPMAAIRARPQLFMSTSLRTSSTASSLPAPLM